MQYRLGMSDVTHRGREGVELYTSNKLRPIRRLQIVFGDMIGCGAMDTRRVDAGLCI